MELDELIKYALWVIFFAAALIGLFFLLKRLGVM